MNTKQRNWLIGLICLSPIIAIADLISFSWIQSMLREQSDIAILIAVPIISLLLFAHWLILRGFVNRIFTILLLAAIVSSCTRIDAGYEGILIKQYGTEKGVQDVNLVTGRVTYNPFTEDVEQFPTFVQTKDYDAFTVNAKDGSVFTVDPTISFKVINGRTPDIFKKYRKELDEIAATTLYNYVKDAFRIQFNKYTTDEVTSRREEFEEKVQNYLLAELEKEGFHLEMLTSGLKYPDMIVAAIDAKNQAVQKAMEIENKLKQTEAEARIKITNAKATADALVINAKGEAEANRLRQQSLTQLLVQQQFIEKWNGQLPTYGTVPQLFKGITDIGQDHL